MIPPFGLTREECISATKPNQLSDDVTGGGQGANKDGRTNSGAKCETGSRPCMPACVLFVCVRLCANTLFN